MQVSEAVVLSKVFLNKTLFRQPNHLLLTVIRVELLHAYEILEKNISPNQII